jgi:hypothetical protein
MNTKKHGVKEVFEQECRDLKFDINLIKKINSFQVGFVQKNEDHMTFFGGNTFGVQIVRFTAQDRDRWFSDVLEIDDITLEEKLLMLPDINAEFHISSDVFNLSTLWVIHGILNSTELTDKQKENAMVDTALILQYKFITSLMFKYFKFPADPQLAAATYASLSYKFAIKQYGSWSATLHARSENIVSKESIHYKVFETFDDDKKIVNALNDTQGRIRDMGKNIYGKMMEAQGMGSRITVTSSLMEHDGEQILKDKTKNLYGYTRYLSSIISDKNSFIKDELLTVIISIQHTMPPKNLIKTLEWMSGNFRHTSVPEVEKLIEKVMVHSFGYLADNSTVLKANTDLAGLVSKLRGVYMSSRSTDIELLEIRELAQGIVTKATGLHNDGIVSSVRTGLCLYICLRAFCMHYYS